MVVRRAEPAALGVDLTRAGVPVAARLDEPALAEGGDLIRLDERTLLVGLGYRTNQAGADVLAEATGLDVVAFDLPHCTARVKSCICSLCSARSRTISSPRTRACSLCGSRNFSPSARSR